MRRLPLFLSLAAAMNLEPSSPDLWMSSSISSTAWLAPPWRGPQRAQTPGGGAGEEVGAAGGHHADGGGGAVLLVIGVEQEDQIQRLHHFGLEIVISL